MSSTSGSDPAPQAAGLDETIGRMERLYRAMTGRDVPPGDTVYALIPVERDPGEYVEEQMSRLVDLLGPTGGAAPAPVFTPAVTVQDAGPEILIHVDLPGVAREQIEVTAHGNVLTVSGTRPSPPSENGSLRLAECPHGAFRRTLILTGARRGAEPSARMKDGVLEIRVARDTTQAEPPRPVPVN